MRKTKGATIKVASFFFTGQAALTGQAAQSGQTGKPSAPFIFFPFYLLAFIDTL